MRKEGCISLGSVVAGHKQPDAAPAVAAAAAAAASSCAYSSGSLALAARTASSWVGLGSAHFDGRDWLLQCTWNCCRERFCTNSLLSVQETPVALRLLPSPIRDTLETSGISSSARGI